MTDEDPQRLKSTGGTPVELARALRALGGDDLDAARLARVAERLDAAIAASGTPATSWLRAWIGTKVGLTSLVVGVGALGVLGYALTANPVAPSADVPAAPAPIAVSAPQEPARARPPEPQLALGEATAAPAPAPVREQPRIDRPAGRSHARPRNERIRTNHGASVAATAETARRGALDPGAASSPEPGAASSPEASAAGAREPGGAGSAGPKPANTPEPIEGRSYADEQPPAKPAATPAQRSEVALLHQARKTAKREPEAALRLLDEHARRFPNGVLVPEREVLAIETLRRLGRDAEAEQRLRRFEGRYPQSIHLRRLERAPAAADDD